jgi:hypothetical protein
LNIPQAVPVTRRNSVDYHSHFKAAREGERRKVDDFVAQFNGCKVDLDRTMHDAAKYLLATRLFKNNQMSFSGPDLMAAKQFLRDMFGHNGLYANVRIEEIAFKPCEILWAPLMHLIAADRTCALALQKILLTYLGRLQLEDDTPVGKAELARLNLNLTLISTRLGKVDHESLMEEAREQFCDYMLGHKTLSILLPAGRLERLESWGVSLAKVADRAIEGMVDSQPYPAMLRTMTQSLNQLLAKVRQAGPLPDEERFDLALLKTGLNTYLMRQWDRKEIKGLLGEGVVNCRQALSVDQWVAVLDLTASDQAPESVLEALHTFPPADTLEAIQKAFWPEHRSRLIRLCGLEGEVPRQEMLHLDGKAFMEELGV